MADQNLDRIRLTFMQEVLPIGMAMVDRARQGGVGKVFEVFKVSEEPFKDLSKEGENAAKNFRDQLDQVSPGLGNPVMSVNVDIEESPATSIGVVDEKELMQLLSRIESRISDLERHFEPNVSADS